jgi:hypothetical protein
MGRTDLQVSGEAAFNSLENVSRLFVLLTDATSRSRLIPGGTRTLSETVTRASDDRRPLSNMKAYS